MARASRGDLSVYTHYVRECQGGDLTHEEFAIDVLASLRHFCDLYGVDFAEADRIAQGHYVAELHEEASQVG